MKPIIFHLYQAARPQQAASLKGALSAQICNKRGDEKHRFRVRLEPELGRNLSDKACVGSNEGCKANLRSEFPKISLHSRPLRLLPPQAISPRLRYARLLQSLPRSLALCFSCSFYDVYADRILHTGRAF